jgi:uncharacterized protein
VLAARRLEPMEKLAADLRRKYRVDVLVEAIDLASPGAADRLKRSLDAKSAPIDILVNNADTACTATFWKSRSSAP